MSADVAPNREAPPRSTGSDLSRLDWRFLLPHRWPERVGWMGGAVAPALPELAEVEVLHANESVGRAPLSAVVACNPDEAELVLASNRVAPGGSLIVEIHSPRRGMSLGGAVRRLRALGFSEVRSHWHWPDLERATRVVPLAARAPIRHLLARTGGGLRGRIQGGTARLLLELGLLDQVAAGSIVATRRGGPSPQSGGSPAIGSESRADSFVHRFLEGRSSGGPAVPGVGPHAPFLVLTPRFRNSSHLVFLLFPDHGDQPAIAVKLARRAGVSPALEEEAARLQAIQGLRPGGFDSIPRVIACDGFEGHALLAETALTGSAMDPARVRADTHGCCSAIVEWLIEVQKCSRRERAAGEPGILLHIERDLAELRAAGLVDANLTESALRAVRSLTEHPIPSVLEHGDLSHPNILLESNGAAAVLDWELSNSNGLPGTDLFFFLAYVARARAQALVGPPAASAIVDAFATRPEWLRVPLARYREGLAIPKAAQASLFMACWVTQAAAVVRRVPEGARRAETNDELRTDWRVEVCRRVAGNPVRFLERV